MPQLSIARFPARFSALCAATTRAAAPLVLVLASMGAQAAGDVKAGEAKAAVCVVCHGPQGNSTNPDWPKLAGQHANYLLKSLRAYKDGTRKDPLMSAQALSLSDDDMNNLAAYFAAQTPK